MDLDTRRNLKQNSFVYDMNGSPNGSLMWLHAVQLMFVLDMCNSSTKHNGSGQVVRVGAAASHVY